LGRPRQQRLRLCARLRRKPARHLGIGSGRRVRSIRVGPIKAEVERILSEKFTWPKDRVDEATAHLWALARSINPQQTVTDCVDPDDDRVLECALEAHAQVIVTGDSHLLKLHPYREISILTPKQFLEVQPWQS